MPGCDISQAVQWWGGEYVRASDQFNTQRLDVALLCVCRLWRGQSQVRPSSPDISTLPWARQHWSNSGESFQPKLHIILLVITSTTCSFKIIYHFNLFLSYNSESSLEPWYPYWEILFKVNTEMIKHPYRHSKINKSLKVLFCNLLNDLSLPVMSTAVE